MSDSKIEVFPNDHLRGAKRGSITLVAYCDFECPDCGKAFLDVKLLLQRYGDVLSYVYRHFPLQDLHPAALCGARYSEAAEKQGRFWTFHDFVYENQHLLQHPHRLLDEACAFGLDVEWMRRDTARRIFDSRIERDISTGKQLGVHATPSYFINGRLVDAMEGVPALSAAIENQLSSSSQTVS